MLLITRAYANTATAALQVLTGLVPLDLQLEAEAEFSGTARLGKSKNIYNPSIYIPKCSKYQLSPLMEDINIITDEEFTGKIRIYTDGSKNEIGTGSAFCVFKENQQLFSWRDRLSRGNSVFQSELHAIHSALKWAEKTDDREFLVSTDSLSSLQALNKFDNTNHQILNIREHLQNTHKIFNFQWVRGHSGVEGNETADILAKSAVSDDSLQITFLPLPLSTLKHKLKLDMLQLWQDRWTISDTGHYTKQFLPKVKTNYQITNRYLHIFLTNHGPFQQHLYDINKRDSPLCICGSPSTSLHYILDCTLTSHFHIKKHPHMSLSDWWTYVEERPFLLKKIVDCMRFIELNEYLFSNPLPFVGNET